MSREAPSDTTDCINDPPGERPCKLDFNKRLPSSSPKLAPGVRVRYNYGQWETDAGGFGDFYFVTNWSALSWAHTRTGVTIPDLEYQGGVDWVRMGCGAWAVPEDATAVRFDDGHVSWVNTSLLDVIGFAESQPSPTGEVQQELFA